RRAFCAYAKRGADAPLPELLPPEAQLGDQGSVPLDVVAPEVVEQPTPPTHHHQQPTTRVMVLRVDLQVLREVVDPLRQECDLHLRGAGVGLVAVVLGDRGGFVGHALPEPASSEERPAGWPEPTKATRPPRDSDLAVLVEQAAGVVDVALHLADERVDG